jgi:Phage tail tube protein, GTA-gp10
MTETETVTWVNAVFGGKVHKLQLMPAGNLDLARELEKEREAGIPTILRRVVRGAYYVDDVRETIRLGLIGGGMTPTDAFIALSRFFDREPVETHTVTACRILTAAISGVPRERAEEVA